MYLIYGYAISMGPECYRPGIIAILAAEVILSDQRWLLTADIRCRVCSDYH